MEEVTGGSENVFQLNKCFASFWNDVDTEKKQKGEYEILRKVEASWGSFCSYFFRKKKIKRLWCMQVQEEKVVAQCIFSSSFSAVMSV